jgi:hypothetical protein
MPESVTVAMGGVLRVGEAFWAADGTGRVSRHVAEAFHSLPDNLRPAWMVRSGAALCRADACHLDGATCAASEEMHAIQMAEIHRNSLQRCEAAAVTARACRLEIEAARKAG